MAESVPTVSADLGEAYSVPSLPCPQKSLVTNNNNESTVQPDLEIHLPGTVARALQGPSHSGRVAETCSRKFPNGEGEMFDVNSKTLLSGFVVDSDRHSCTDAEVNQRIDAQVNYVKPELSLEKLDDVKSSVELGAELDIDSPEETLELGAELNIDRLEEEEEGEERLLYYRPLSLDPTSSVDDDTASSFTTESSSFGSSLSGDVLNNVVSGADSGVIMTPLARSAMTDHVFETTRSEESSIVDSFRNETPSPTGCRATGSPRRDGVRWHVCSQEGDVRDVLSDTNETCRCLRCVIKSNNLSN